MFNQEKIRPYELSLWTLQDDFISTLKSEDIFNKGQIETPRLNIRNDGTLELNFLIPMYYFEEGKKIENPIWYNVIDKTLIVNLRKLKLIFNKGKSEEEIFEFVINKVREEHADGKLYCEVTAEGLAFQELGKIGYKISLSSEDFIEEYNNWYNSTVGINTENEKFDYPTDEDKAAAEPKNNINYWCDKIFKNSNWSYSIQMDWSSYDGILINGEVNNEEREKENLRRTDKIYEEEYISSWEYTNTGTSSSEVLLPSKMESFKEKLRLVDLEKSNIYNLTQNLAETFGVFCKYKYHYDKDYHIIKKECIFYNNFLAEQEGKIDIIYPYSTSRIEREIDSIDVITKMFVAPVEDDTSPSGLITIADVAANKSREDYILNFDYLYSIGTISQEQYDAIADYERSLHMLNIEIEPLAMQIANLQEDLVKYEAKKTIAKEAQILDLKQMEQSKVFLSAISNNTGYLYKNLANPYRGVLLESLEKKGTYYIKITQEGVDLENKFSYPLNEGDINQITGITLHYYASIPGAENTIETRLSKYSSTEEFKINTDECGNLVSISNLYHMPDAVSKNYLVTFAYSPKLHYENIYNTYSKKFAEDEIEEKEAILKIQEIQEKIEKIENKYKELLEKKNYKVSEFENMMGPALKEGTWQADNYNDFGSKYSQKVKVNELNSSHINFLWDEKNFDEEQLLYYRTFGDNGNALTEVYYYCIDLSGVLQNIKNDLDRLSFIYNDDKEQMTIGSELQYAFIKKGNLIKPVLLLTDKAFKLTDAIKQNCYLGTIHSSISNGEVEISTKRLVENLTWIENNSGTIAVYPRLKVDSLLLKVSEEELVIKYIDQILRNFYDYSVLARGENYFITLKSKIMLQDAKINEKVFDISYTLSNASLYLFLDALEVSKTNASPKVSYTLQVSALNKNFIKTAYKNLNRIVNINDSELKFENVQGYISELDLDLDNPWEDNITIQNYKTKFEDLFSTIVASSEQMKANAFAYNNAASAFGPGGTLKPSIIQNTINQTDLTYAFQDGNLTIDEVNGIWAKSDNGVVAMRGGGIFCATQVDNDGNWLWNTGILPSGINASLITAGQLDTNLIRVYAGDNLRLQLNADGLFAYNKDDFGEANLYQYVVHNSEGLFLKQPKEIREDNEGEPILDKENLINKVAISWDGLTLSNNQGTPVFYADDKGNLVLEGKITANTGSIGGWTIQENGLITTDGKAGISANNSSSSDQKMFWVTGSENEDGTVNEFRVTKDGTMYCNDAIIKGTISAGSFVGSTSVGEIDEQLRTITIDILDGTTFSFENRNYDNNLVIYPDQLKFRISTNALTSQELTPPEGENSEYRFYYKISDITNEEVEWTELISDNSGEYENLIWEPNYLTFRLKSDIMYIGLEETILPHTILYFKVTKKGQKRIVSETGEISYEGCEYEDIIQLSSEVLNLGKNISAIDPVTYSFIDNEVNIDSEKEFSVILTGFIKEEVTGEENFAYWKLNGENEETYLYQNFEGENKTENGITIKLIGEEKDIKASIIIPSSKIPSGKNIILTFGLNSAHRTSYCYKTKSGQDGVNVILRSSSGSILANSDTSTILKTEIYYGSQLVNENITDNSFYYVWKKDGKSLSIIDINETESLEYSSENEEFFLQKQVYVTVADFGVKSDYSCYVFSTLEEAKEEYNLGV